MRTNIEIDDALLAEAMKAAALPTKRATVDAALRLLVRIQRQKTALANLCGIGWGDDLDAMRRGTAPEPK